MGKKAKSEIRLPIFESCPLTNRPKMDGESTFSEKPALKSAISVKVEQHTKSALLILSKLHVVVMSEKEIVSNYLRLQ